jgi:hypothetical protein
MGGATSCLVPESCQHNVKPVLRAMPSALNHDAMMSNGSELTSGYCWLRRSARASLAPSGRPPSASCCLRRTASRCTAAATAAGSASMSAENASFSAVFLLLLLHQQI